MLNSLTWQHNLKKTESSFSNVDEQETTPRNKEWLEERFNQIWSLFFPDVEKKDVFIRWKGKWKNKFGHITKRKGRTEIVINALFQDLRVPEDIIKLTIAHEIVHYMHGFHSHLPRQFSHPHKGGIVDKELIRRGFGYAVKKEKEWIKKEWSPIYKSLMPHKATRPQPRKQFTLFSFLRSRVREEEP